MDEGKALSLQNFWALRIRIYIYIAVSFERMYKQNALEQSQLCGADIIHLVPVVKLCTALRGPCPTVRSLICCDIFSAVRARGHLAR